MKQLSNQALFIFFSVVTIYLLYLLSPILTPFVFGALLAYLTNPLVTYLDKRLPHLLSVLCVFLMLFGLLAILVLILSPIIEKQFNALVDLVPQIMAWTQATLIPWVQEVIKVDTIKSTISTLLPKSGLVLTTLVKSGHTVIIWILNLVLIPVVTFYLLRDWDLILNNIKKNLPTASKPTITRLARECDDVLGAFFRGQLLVMLSLCLIYGVGLTLIGLKIGLVIGLIGGLLSIIPFLGSIFVVVTACLTAVIQYGSWDPLLWVLGVYVIGQGIEGYVLSPYLIGKRIGLHPVAVIFSIMAGGTLFGFFGILAALPVAAIIVVLLRFLRSTFAKTAPAER
jgi:predicted PurR-regulated permease PerM